MSTDPGQRPTTADAVSQQRARLRLVGADEPTGAVAPRPGRDRARTPPHEHQYLADVLLAVQGCEAAYAQARRLVYDERPPGLLEAVPSRS